MSTTLVVACADDGLLIYIAHQPSLMP